MYQVFNMGHRFEIYVPPKLADSIISIAGRYNLDARIVGRVEQAKTNKLSIRSDKGEFEY